MTRHRKRPRDSSGYYLRHTLDGGLRHVVSSWWAPSTGGYWQLSHTASAICEVEGYPGGWHDEKNLPVCGLCISIAKFKNIKVNKE